MGLMLTIVSPLTDSAQLAIVSTSKHFLSLPLIQQLVKEIYLGHLIYSPLLSRSLINDSYISERRRQRRRNSHSRVRSPILDSPAQRGARATETTENNEVLVYTYNPFEAGWLDHQRLRVPKWRKWLEFASFASLLALYVTALSCESRLVRSFAHT